PALHHRRHGSPDRPRSGAHRGGRQPRRTPAQAEHICQVMAAPEWRLSGRGRLNPFLGGDDRRPQARAPRIHCRYADRVGSLTDSSTFRWSTLWRSISRASATERDLQYQWQLCWNRKSSADRWKARSLIDQFSILSTTWRRPAAWMRNSSRKSRIREGMKRSA